MWYVINVDTGREDYTLELINRILDTTLGRAFLPKVVYRKKIKVEWQDVYRPFVPGYLFFETGDPEALFYELKKVPKRTKLLRVDEDMIPVKRDEESFLRGFLNDGDNIDLSRGHKEGDRVIIDSGPLVGKDALIKKIDAHKRKAVISTEMFGRVMELTVGLEVLPMNQ